MSDTYQVKNKLGIPLTLSDGLGDEVLLPPYSTHAVDAKFIDFQLPQLSQAEVIGFDYEAHFAKLADAAKPPVKEEPSVKPLQASQPQRRDNA